MLFSPSFSPSLLSHQKWDTFLLDQKLASEGHKTSYAACIRMAHELRVVSQFQNKKKKEESKRMNVPHTMKVIWNANISVHLFGFIWTQPTRSFACCLWLQSHHLRVEWWQQRTCSPHSLQCLLSDPLRSLLAPRIDQLNCYRQVVKTQIICTSFSSSGYLPCSINSAPGPHFSNFSPQSLSSHPVSLSRWAF